MKIIRVSNFDDPTISECLVCDNVALGYSEALVENLNRTFSGPIADYFFELVEDDYVLYKFDPNS